MNLDDGSLSVVTLYRGYAWLDTGTMESLYEAFEFVRSVERAQDLPVSVPEEIAWENGWIDTPALEAAAEAYGKSVYGGHLKVDDIPVEIRERQGIKSSNGGLSSVCCMIKVTMAILIVALTDHEG